MCDWGCLAGASSFLFYPSLRQTLEAALEAERAEFQRRLEEERSALAAVLAEERSKLEEHMAVQKKQFDEVRPWTGQRSGCSVAVAAAFAVALPLSLTGPEDLANALPRCMSQRTLRRLGWFALRAAEVFLGVWHPRGCHPAAANLRRAH